MKRPVVVFVLLTGLIIAGSLPYRTDLKFNHRYHIEEEELACVDCHTNVLSSSSGMDNLMVKEATCLECHEREDGDDGECTLCHDSAQPSDFARVESYSPKFSHALHGEQEGIECLECHGGIETAEAISQFMHLPVMDDCMACHATPAEVEGCYQCHSEEENLRPADHTLAWEDMHGMDATAMAQNCNSCHRENFCIECHQGENIAGFSHNADFMLVHGQQFITREKDCAACHTSRDFCVDCHVNVNMVYPVSHVDPEWPGQGHAVEARFDFEACGVCHTARDAACSDCHN
ncbi:MAG TPA: cytochrome c3 family protein [Calditrichia bacterium]|nr:hypothetical protein [Calditrichota bacterium]HQU72016.1 cytochrome c3 family protein [Calditrichia bacterium]HQV32034.1 cytochrome c3 family protein [Calditrichia bacterium]